MTHIIPISAELRFLKIPTHWVQRTGGMSGVVMLVPEVDQDYSNRKLAPITDPWELRNQFLKMKHSEAAALEFLNQVGVWKSVEDLHASKAAGGVLLSGAFGYRYFIGRALPLTLEDLWRDQEHWGKLLRNPAKLRGEFRPPPDNSARPIDKLSFAMDARLMNTLPFHLESKGTYSHAVIQPSTGHELMIATAQIDLISGAAFHVCQRLDCGIPFSGRKRKYCSWYCGHIVAVRTGRERKSKRRSRS